MSKPVTTFKPSPSGMYQVRLARTHEHEGFVYKPSASAITVDEAILKSMIAAKAVLHVDAV